MATESVTASLNKLVATQGLLYIKLHQAHWYIKGPNFFDLHVKLEEFYDELTAQMDLTAERLLQLGGEPYSTLQEFIEHSVIKESAGDKNKKPEDMIEAVVSDFEIYRDELGEGIDLFDDASDDVTVDILTEQKREVDKVIWMLWAYLGKDALGN